ncbi:MAG: hypothetical protein CSA96_09225 [Bacteroidetes bacterium]|nr:MAG: hypothetical protein CSA96_09225 [Bacteroidota bacterium]
MEENLKNQEQEAMPDQHEHHDEHNYDGIEELDNPPPRWIMAIFYITIAFSIFFTAYYFWLDVGTLQDERYIRQSARHDAKYQLSNSEKEELALLTDAASLEEGKAIYSEMSCFACHGMQGEGNAIGPNLCDDAWLINCDFQSVFNIIKNGNPAKGMTAFKTQLSDTRIQKVSSYVLSLKGSNPPNAKQAQGEHCE